VVSDATCRIETHLVLQTLEFTGRVVVCVNRMDEAEAMGIRWIWKVSQTAWDSGFACGCPKRPGAGGIVSAVCDLRITKKQSAPFHQVYQSH
jgi:hypothetical protein